MDTLQCYEHHEALWRVYLLGTVVATRGGTFFVSVSHCFRMYLLSLKCIVFSISVSERRMIGSSTEI
jgi:hypothetical protein